LKHEKGKAFFFAKKKQKTFAVALASPYARLVRPARRPGSKGFLVLFFKKEHIFFLMSGNRFRGEATRRPPVQLPLLDRLFDEAPERLHDPPRGAADTMLQLRQAVRRDLEMLLNARRRWRSPPAALRELACSPLSFGIPDCAAARYADKRERERLRQEIEIILRRFEPRFAQVRVSLVDPADTLDGTLHLHIDALLHADPAPEPVAFDTVVQHEAGLSVRTIDV